MNRHPLQDDQVHVDKNASKSESFCESSSLTELCSVLTSYCNVNPLTPMRDQDRISPYNINTISTRLVMRMKNNINLEIISSSNTKLSGLRLLKFYG